MSRDQLFYRFAIGLFILLVLYGCGMILVLLLAGETVGLRMVSGFSSMFAGALGFGAGYLLGKNGS